MFWVSAQRLHEMRTIHPHFQLNPELLLPEELVDSQLSRDTAIINILRSRLANSAPLNTEQLAQSLEISLTEAETALLHLENEGYVLRGNWRDTASRKTDHETSENQADTMPEWCERSLLNNSHRNAIHNNRKTVKPVSSADFFCFLFDWQHLTPQHRYRGAQTLNLILEQLQGFQAPISVWQKSIIYNRITDISDLMFWLDSLISSGQYLWLRLDNAAGSQKLTQNTPITFIPRQALNHWQHSINQNHIPEPTVSAQLLLDILNEKGALFYDELQTRTGFLKSQLDETLGELIALGLISCDLLSGLTRLFAKPLSRHKKPANPLPAGGRWSIIQPLNKSEQVNSIESETTLTYLVRSLLRRYGIIFKALLTREVCHNQWQQLLPILQRMEWSDEIRSGRFVNGQYGQQFALPEAVQQLQKNRTDSSNPESIIINATDPLNLIGILTPDDKISAHAGNRILFKQGKAIAYLTGKDVVFLENIEQGQHWEIKNSLIRKTDIVSKQSMLLAT